MTAGDQRGAVDEREGGPWGCCPSGGVIVSLLGGMRRDERGSERRATGVCAVPRGMSTRAVEGAGDYPTGAAARGEGTGKAAGVTAESEIVAREGYAPSEPAASA